MGVFDFLKKTGSKIYDFGKKAVSGIFNVANKGRDVIKKGIQYVKNLPVVGEYVNQLVEKPIGVLGGASISQIAGQADRYLDQANTLRDQVKKGDVGGSIKTLAQIRSQF